MREPTFWEDIKESAPLGACFIGAVILVGLVALGVLGLWQTIFN